MLKRCDQKFVVVAEMLRLRRLPKRTRRLQNSSGFGGSTVQSRLCTATVCSLVVTEVVGSGSSILMALCFWLDSRGEHGVDGIAARMIYAHRGGGGRSASSRLLSCTFD